jgi:ferredoxin
MIVGQQKAIAEIKEKLAPFTRVLILGCGTCVKTCFAGGEDEVAILAAALRLAFRKDGRKVQIEELTIERQCEDAFIKEAAAAVARNEAVLSLACGAGVQMVADRFSKVLVLPGVDTTFIGILEKPGLFTEKCLGCGSCIVDKFGGVCPVSRCAKKLLNGPCGGSRDGKCEVNPGTDCAWQIIIDRAKETGGMDKLAAYVPPRDWRSSYSGGPRKLFREDQVI